MKAPCREVGPFQRSPAQVPSRKDLGGASLCRKGRVRVLSSGKSRDAEDDECGEETYPRKFWKNKIVGRGSGFDSMDGVPAALRAGSLQRGHLHPYQSQFPSVRKIGYADDLQKRLRQLNRSAALPYAFRAYATYEVNRRLTDRALHSLLDKLDPTLRAIDTLDGKTRTREFFEMSAEDAYQILEAVAHISGTEERLHRMTPTGEEMKDEAKAEEARRAADECGSRRASFCFSMVGLKPDDEILYKNDESKRAVVVDDTHVEYEGVTTSLSGLARKLRGQPINCRGRFTSPITD